MRDIADYTKKYVIHGFEDYQVLYRRKKILERMDAYRPNSVLEIGCGMEPLFLYSEVPFFTVVEPSDVFCDNAHRLCGKDNRDIKIVNGFFEDKVDVLVEHYDMIICSSLLHELENPKQMLDSIRRVSSANTIIHVNVPNAMSLHRIFAKESRIISDVHSMSDRNRSLQQSIVYDMDKLVNLIEDVHGRVMAKGSYFIKPFTHRQMYEMIEKGIINEQILDGLYDSITYMPELGSEIFVDFKYDR